MIAFFVIYWMIGCGLAFDRLTHIAAVHPDDFVGYILASVQTIVTWPWWIGSR